jgi:hypothetical protein
MTNRIAAGVVALVLTAQGLGAQQSGRPQPPDQRPGMSGMAEQMRVLDSLNARLDTLVSRMNQATGNKKVAAMADVINELVAQRKAMQRHMHQMMESRQGRQGMMMRMTEDSATGEHRSHSPERCTLRVRSLSQFDELPESRGN